jgi:hypothetical protein
MTKRKRFFFEKKNQKTFADAGARWPSCGGSMGWGGFCWFFFEKEALPPPARLTHDSPDVNGKCLKTGRAQGAPA